MDVKHLRTIGRCLDDATKLATEEWFSQHGGMRDREEAFANGIKTISGSVELSKGGAVTVHMVITARSPQQNLVDYQKYQRSGAGGYLRVLIPLR